MTDQQPIVETRGLSRRFDDTLALDLLTLTINHSEVFGILGHNGAGKTTFLRLVNGVLRPTIGTVEVFGLFSYEAGAEVRRHTGVVTESTALDDFLSVRESLHAYGTFAGMEEYAIERRVDELLVTFDLAEIGDRQVREISAGMRQRAAFARALVHDPDLLLLDEPTANMDPVAARHVRSLVVGLARQTGRTVVLSTHNLAEAQEVCDRVAVLQHGTLQALGTLEELARVGDSGWRTRVTLDAAAAARALDLTAGFGQVDLDGRGDTIVVQHPSRDDVPKIVATLVEAQLPVYDVSTELPSLEDVYLELHRQREAP